MRIFQHRFAKPVIVSVLLLISFFIIANSNILVTQCATPETTTPTDNFCPLHPSTGHDFHEWVTIQALSCTDIQVEVQNCDCGYGIVRRTEALGHTMNEYEVIKAPTCTEDGHQSSTCARCESVHTLIMSATGHDWGKWEKCQDQSCTQDEQHKHACQKCGVEELNVTAQATGHQWGEWTTTQTLSCTQDKVDVRVCKICLTEDRKVQHAPGHSYNAFTQTKDPTCAQFGEKTRTCTVCGHVDKQQISKTKHQYSNGKCKFCGYDDPSHWPKTYSDDGVTITIYKVTGYGGGNTTCYVADVQLTDYSRFFTACGKNKYGGQSGTKAAAKLQNAVLAINGCYSAPYLDYTVVRRGVIYNGANRNLCLPAVYSSKTGLFTNVWEGQRNDLTGKKVQDLVDAGLVTDTFCFGPPILVDGVVTGGTGGGRAQRTFIGTDGKPGHLLLCVSNGRYSDGVSAGLTYKEMGQLMKDYGCNFGIPLDGGGSSTMVFKGQVLNQLADGQERTWIVDFCCVGY